jgi:CheY-like chemotaxis protein
MSGGAGTGRCWWPFARRAPEAPATVLVADDDADIVAALKVRLGKAGFAVLAARDGAEALRLARDGGPGVILLDIKMPAGDGFTVLERLRAEPETARIPVLFLTANPQDANRERAAALGAAGFVAKPYDGVELVAVVRKALEADGTPPGADKEDP